MSERKNKTTDKSQDGDAQKRSDAVHATVNFCLPPGSRVHIVLENRSPADVNAESEITFSYDNFGEIFHSMSTVEPRHSAAHGVGSYFQGILKWMRRIGEKLTPMWKHRSLAAWLFLFALVFYLGTRLIGLEDFPIYFFTDEAVQTVRAADFVRDGYKNYAGEILPTFFINNSLYCLSLSVYNQIIPYLLFGKSVLVTRLAAVLVTLLAAIWVGWTLRDAFKIEHWWLGTLLLSITPVWFLHSRTAFEYCLMVTFYSGFVYYYSRYRSGETRKLYPALVLGALSFYSYMPGQVIMVATGLLLLAFDFRYHWKHRNIGFRGLGVLVLVALPLARFLIIHPAEFSNRLVRYHSYWVRAIPVSEKIWIYFREYMSGLNPLYWYFPHELDLIRHVMAGYGHMLWLLFPFMLLGLWLVIRRHWKSGIGRILIAAILAAPAGAATVEMGLTRALTMVIPLVVLTGLGFSESIDWLAKRRDIKKERLSFLVFIIFAVINCYMLYDALIRGPVWYDNYGLTGMQYGAQQVFTEARLYLEENPDTKLDISPNWMNGANEIARFFLNDPLPISMQSISGFENVHQELDSNNLFIMTPAEFKRAVVSDKFTNLNVEKVLPYPNGDPGFYFVRMQYVAKIDEVLEAELAERRELRSERIVVRGQDIDVQYSTLDMGKLEYLFDGDPSTVIRTAEANPMEVKIFYSEPQLAQKISLKVGGGPTWIQVEIITSEPAESLIYSQELTSVPEPRFAEFLLEEQVNISAVLFQVRNMDDGEPSHVHVWDVMLE
jgi:hypothetical protein